MVALGEVSKVVSGGTPSRNESEYWSGNIPWIKTGQINFHLITEADEFITQKGMQNSSARIIPKGTILMAMYGQGITRGKVAVLGIDATINQACAAIILGNSNVSRDFVYLVLQSKYEELRSISDARGGNQSNLNSQLIKDLQIPLPPLETQQRIVTAIEREQALVNASKELIQLFGQKIKDRIAAVWGRADVPEVGIGETVLRAMPYASTDGELAMVAEEQVQYAEE